MKNHYLFLLISFLSFNSYSQITFNKGYFVDNSHRKIDCLIKNLDWKDNPTNIEYKLTEADKSIKLEIKDVEEFAVDSNFKFVRKKVLMDRSSSNLNNMSVNKNPDLMEETLFLKVLIEGKANLYYYEMDNLYRFFYSTDNLPVQQLIYKQYLISISERGTNNQYKQDLWNNLKCPTITLKKVEQLEYNSKSLEDFFILYNTCNNSTSTNYTIKEKKDLFNLTLRPRINSTSLSVENNMTSTTISDFDSKINFGLGVEFEYILPFNKNKWSVSVEPTFQSFKSESTTSNVPNVSGNKIIGEVDYKSIDLFFTARHYLFLNKSSKFFVNLSYSLNFKSKSSLNFYRADGSLYNSLNVNPTNNLALGIGYKFLDRFSVELKLQSTRNIVDGYFYWNSKYKSTSLILGYSLF